MKNYIRKCIICGKEDYVCNSWKDRKYCSIQCYRNKPSIRDRKCLNCDNIYHAHRKTQKYCSSKCQLNYEYLHNLRNAKKGLFNAHLKNRQLAKEGRLSLQNIKVLYAHSQSMRNYESELE